MISVSSEVQGACAPQSSKRPIRIKTMLPLRYIVIDYDKLLKHGIFIEKVQVLLENYSSSEDEQCPENTKNSTITNVTTSGCKQATDTS